MSEKNHTSYAISISYRVFPRIDTDNKNASYAFCCVTLSGKSTQEFQRRLTFYVRRVFISLNINNNMVDFFYYLRYFIITVISLPMEHITTTVSTQGKFSLFIPFQTSNQNFTSIKSHFEFILTDTSYCSYRSYILY